MTNRQIDPEETEVEFMERPAWGVVLVVIYAALILLPLLFAAVLRPDTDHGFVRELGKSFALVGIAILALQAIVAARLRWIERPFGLDILLRFHKMMAVFAVVLILFHPVLLAAEGSRWELLYRLDVPWYIWFGKAALVLLLLQGVTSLFREQIRLGFDRWRLLHNQAVIIFGLVFIHSLIVGGDLQAPSMRNLWWVMLGAVVAGYGYHKIVAPARTRGRPYRVTEVKPETHNVWTLSMEPQPGRGRLNYRPGQFQFIRLWRAQPNLSTEEHHFTIASSPTQTDVQMTIKESGDFTATIGETKPGDLVSIQGPYGRFSYTLHTQDKHLVFIAGGIGITPLMSMLRHMRATKADVDVLLIYGNKTEADIVFREELERMASHERGWLQVAHVLSHEDEHWPGEKGFVDKEKIQRLVGDGLMDRVYYVCGPAPMARLVFRALRDLGVPAERITYERFWL
ncbi:MAG: oxidoreductase [Armatimonadetes bacterium]|nr:oxidoreductase [Armatimonadota bacterium]NIM22958.1 oxidoreductase [Armatimonadota bacterium]NIM66829.1 oxidoreductase [Armatimonadota bacterium]NIM75370.1 oxidoreductase [Armatimonadota bacterium]NIN05017.1 oxidoreductase [Armatimonadota bacterium]